MLVAKPGDGSVAAAVSKGGAASPLSASGVLKGVASTAKEMYGDLYNTISNAGRSVNTVADAANELSQFNAATAQQYSLDQMDYSAQLQRELRQTAYQDTVQSMREAGLNPMLAYMNGAVSSSSPSGSASAAQTFEQSGKTVEELKSVFTGVDDLLRGAWSGLSNFAEKWTEKLDPAKQIKNLAGAIKSIFKH